jgi:hypothetical protein
MNKSRNKIMAKKLKAYRLEKYWILFNIKNQSKFMKQMVNQHGSIPPEMMGKVPHVY